MTVSENAKLAARELTRVWREKPRVFRHWIEDESAFIDIASSANTSVAGITSISTVGLCDHDLGMGRVRLEIMAAFPTAFAQGANVVATCAFNAFKDRMPTRPDVIHPNAVALYRPETPVPHALLTDPFIWEPGPDILDIPEGKLAWLQIVPISEAERIYAAQRGPDVLTSLFEQQQIDIFDLERASVV
jgi:hypothetical protein